MRPLGEMRLRRGRHCQDSVCMRAARLAIAAFSLLVLTAHAGAQDAPRHGLSAPAGDSYYVEFRARTGGILGHAYITYGRLDRSGRPIDRRFAGLYPDDEYEDVLMTFGPLIFAPAHIRAEKKDWATAPSAVYRRTLSAAQYAHLEWFLRQMRSRKLRWNLVFHSCSDFVGEVARELGLVIPLAWATPSGFINELQALNER
jgi:hypothetical protein